VTVPHDPKPAILVNKELAGRGQLHTTIALWSSYGDPVSIHTLAAAAQGILQGLAGKDHPQSHMGKWIKSFPKRVQNIIRDSQNFFKHAWTDPKSAKAELRNNRGRRLHLDLLKEEIGINTRGLVLGPIGGGAK
jgi:hypothetical protein